MSHSTHADLARRPRDAYSGGVVPSFRDVLAPTDVDAAYAVQELNTRHWLAAGRRIVGRKVGLTAKSVQAQLGVTEPDFGVLSADIALDLTRANA